MCPTTLLWNLPGPYSQHSLPLSLLEEDGSKWATSAACFREAMQAMHHWSYFDETTTRPLPKDATRHTDTEHAAIEGWDREDAIA